MHDLKNYLSQLKKELSRKKEKRSEIEKKIKEVILADFKEEKILTYLKSFYIKNGTLFIESSSKVFAQEMFWRREQLKEKINQEKEVVKKVVIR